MMLSPICLLPVSLIREASLFQLFTVDLHRDFANAGPARYGLGLCPRCSHFCPASKLCPGCPDACGDHPHGETGDICGPKYGCQSIDRRLATADALGVREIDYW